MARRRCCVRVLRLLAVAVVTVAYCAATAVDSPDATLEPQADRLVIATIEAHPNHADDASSFSASSVAAAPASSDAVLTAPSSRVTPSVSRVYAPVPSHILDDDLPPLFSFDADATAFASLVLRVSRRVTTAGMWQPREGAAHVEPPATAPTALSNTLNLCVSGHYRERAAGGDPYRALHLHILPGPSFTRGSLSALADVHGAGAIGFEQAFHTTMHDLPGFGPITHIRTMSGQQNENWIQYTSGVYDEASKKVLPGLAIYTLLANVWNDPMLAKEQLAQHKLQAEFDPALPPQSMNALGLRVRVSADFAIQPFEFGVASNLRKSTPAAPSETPVETKYARVIDTVMYQQRKFLFLGAAYTDGFIRIFSRGGVLRNELNTRNTTVLLVAMSNWGSSTTTASSHAGGAREANAAINGAQNGNQLMLYATEAGIGIVRMARIYSEVDQYCKWDAAAAAAQGGIRSGHDLSAISFDALSQSIIYLVSHADRTLYVLNTNLGRSTAARNEQGGRVIQPGGNPCAMSAAITLRLSPAATAISKRARGPQFELLSLRGLLFLSSAAAGALLVFNTSTINALPMETGVEFLLERQLFVPDASASPLQPIHLSQLVADRIDLLLVGGVSVTGASDPLSSTKPAPLHVFQMFLSQADHPSTPYSYSWLTSSRTPLFLIGLVLVLGYQFLQRRKKRRAAMGGDGDDEEFDPTAELRGGGGGGGRGPFGSRGRGGRGGSPMMSEHDIMNAMSESSTLRGRGNSGSGGGRGGGLPLGPGGEFDQQAFMSDFLSWQQTNEGRAASASTSGQPAKGAAYLDLLSRDRARARARNGGAGPRNDMFTRKTRPDPIPSFRGLAQQQVALKNRLATLRENSATMAQARSQLSRDMSNYQSVETAAEEPMEETYEEHLYDERIGGDVGYDSDDAAYTDAPPVHGGEPTRDEYADGEEEEEEDGPTYHGAYEQYEYNPREYARGARPTLTEEDEGVEYEEETRDEDAQPLRTYPIDHVLDDDEEDAHDDQDAVYDDSPTGSEANAHVTHVPAPAIDDDLVNDEADAAGEEWVDEAEQQAVAAANSATLAQRRPQHQTNRQA